jgi:hypothetical protein
MLIEVVLDHLTKTKKRKKSKISVNDLGRSYLGRFPYIQCGINYLKRENGNEDN